MYLCVGGIGLSVCVGGLSVCGGGVCTCKIHIQLPAGSIAK